MKLHIKKLSYHDAEWSQCRRIRQSVFIDEQHVPPVLEWDEADITAIHLLACMGDAPSACARVLPDGHIGRMAVLPEWRGQGFGDALLLKAVQECRQLEVPYALLSAQTHAVGFYQKAGFKICSEPYLDANIMHVDMRLELV